jgi:fucose permease
VTTTTATATGIRASLLGLAYLGFISLGLPDGLLGVGWPSISDEFGVPREAVGFLIILGTVGYVSSSVAAGFTIARLGVGWLLAGSTGLVSLALIGYATSPGLALLVGFALLLGLGSGAIDSGLNAYAAANFGARHMNWLHASFGFGATVGPLVMTSVLAAGLTWRWGYGVVGAAQAALALAFLLTARSWSAHRTAPVDAPAATATAAAADSHGAGPAAGKTGPADEVTGSTNEVGPADGAAGAPAERPRRTVPIRETLALPAVWLGAAAFAVYVGIEIGAGLWAYTLLTEGRNLSASIAGTCVAAYWGGLFVGRVLLGAAGDRINTGRVLLISLGGMITGAVLTALPAPGWLAVAGLVLLGLSAAPVFPLMTLTTADRVGQEHADRAIGVQMGTCALGGAALPATLGVLMGRIDVEAFGPTLVVLSVLLLVLYLASVRQRGRRETALAAPPPQPA